MIVVIGNPVLVRQGDDLVIGALAGRIAASSAAAGSSVQLVGKVGDDPDGDALLLALAAAGVGHVAVLRDPANRTGVETIDVPEGPDPLTEAERLEIDEVAAEGGSGGVLPGRPALDAGDVELALRYLVDYRVVVIGEPLDDGTAAIVTDAADFAGAQVVAVVMPGVRPAARLDTATILEAPRSDPDGTFARLVGAYASALDRGETAAAAWQGAALAGGWRPSTEAPSAS